MQPAIVRSSFARLSPLAARCVLAAFALTALLFVGITLSKYKSGYADAPYRGEGDVELYRAEVDRIAAGEGSYQAAAAELHKRGYPTRSIFNWRTPLPMALIGHLPSPLWGQALLCALAALATLFAWELAAREAGPLAGLLCALLMIGAGLPCGLGDCFVMPELWCGVLIAFSAAMYGLRRAGWGLVLGVAALFMRELAAPYCAVCVLLAARDRRWREVAYWAVAGVAYAAFYAWHIAQVLPLAAALGHAHQQGWVRFGGAAFVISTVQVNAFLLLLPQWISALYLAAALLGFAGWNTPAGQRIGLAAAIYVLALGVIGQPFNQYWGCVIAPLLCFGAARVAVTLRDLLGAARQARPEVSPAA